MDWNTPSPHHAGIHVKILKSWVDNFTQFLCIRHKLLLHILYGNKISISHAGMFFVWFLIMNRSDDGLTEKLN
jgi:hypothetical protein